MKVTRAVCGIYAAACFAALALMLAGALGWQTLDGRPGVHLTDLLAMPWSLLVDQMSDPGMVGKLVLGAAAMALNLAIIFSIGRWLANRT